MGVYDLRSRVAKLEQLARATPYMPSREEPEKVRSFLVQAANGHSQIYLSLALKQQYAIAWRIFHQMKDFQKHGEEAPTRVLQFMETLKHNGRHPYLQSGIIEDNESDPYTKIIFATTGSGRLKAGNVQLPHFRHFTITANLPGNSADEKLELANHTLQKAMQELGYVFPVRTYAGPSYP
jgi:hypothetical protein